MQRSKTLVAIAVVAVTAALTAQAGAVPGPVAQQETPTPTNETPTEEEATPTNETPTEEEATPTNETPTPGDEPLTPEDGAENETGETPTVTFEDQETNGTTVTVSDVTLNQSGYIVIHDRRLDSGETVGSVIGASDYLPAGTYDNVTITLFDVPGADFNETNVTTADETPTDTATATPTDTETATETDNETDNETQRLAASQELTAMLHVENSGNQTLDYVETAGLLDGPVTVNDTPVTDTANVTVVEDSELNETGTATPTETETATPTETETATPTETGPAIGGETGTETPTGTP